MKQDKNKPPTDAELEILQVLWQQGPSTVRSVHQALESSRGTGYNSVLKLMQIMTEKTLLERDTAVRPQIFRPIETRTRTQKRLLRRFVDRAFSGSTGNLALQALSTQKASAEELRQIRELLDQLEAKGDAS